MRAIMRLLIPRGVPVRIKHNNRIRPSERDAQRSRARAEEVREQIAVGVVEERDLVLAAGEACGAVEAQVAALYHAHVVLDDVCVCVRVYESVCMCVCVMDT